MKKTYTIYAVKNLYSGLFLCLDGTWMIPSNQEDIQKLIAFETVEDIDDKLCVDFKDVFGEIIVTPITIETRIIF